ncbi:hypothetical protein [Rhizobium leguminosarum]|nr:hypothetical protein [Rhizobium leguminosarum]
MTDIGIHPEFKHVAAPRNPADFSGKPEDLWAHDSTSAEIEWRNGD